jgi:hypothetical protein
MICPVHSIVETASRSVLELSRQLNINSSSFFDPPHMSVREADLLFGWMATVPSRLEVLKEEREFSPNKVLGAIQAGHAQKATYGVNALVASSMALLYFFCDC